MSALTQMAERQIQRHQDLQSTVQAAGFSYSDLADGVNPQNLEPRSRDMYIKLSAGVQALSNTQQARSRAKSHDNSFSLG